MGHGSNPIINVILQARLIGMIFLMSCTLRHIYRLYFFFFLRGSAVFLGPWKITSKVSDASCSCFCKCRQERVAKEAWTYVLKIGRSFKQRKKNTVMFTDNLYVPGLTMLRGGVTKMSCRVQPASINTEIGL